MYQYPFHAVVCPLAGPLIVTQYNSVWLLRTELMSSVAVFNAYCKLAALHLPACLPVYKPPASLCSGLSTKPRLCCLRPAPIIGYMCVYE